MFAAPFDQFASLVSTLDPAVRRALAAVGVFVLVSLAGRLLVVPAATRVVRRRNRENPTIQEATDLYLRIAVLVAAVVAAVIAAGYGRVLTRSALVVAAATLVIGVAGQEVVGNLVSGMFLVTDPNFNVDDYIAWNEREGTVEAIGFRTTRVRTVDNREVTVPNTELAANPVDRPYSRSRVRETIRLPFDYDADVDRVEASLAPPLAEMDGIREEPAPSATIDEFDASAVWLSVVYWVANPMETDVPTVNADAMGRIKAVCDEEELPLGPPAYQHLSGAVSLADAET
ncbi:small-conductance mechanosensitive channel [Halogeometricum pallidum JCM 14848]|uniref:Small-conductance mechanosensitive channel n=1 Tax=Halogeometricum pallidum JCM 14848 TaxID=1227487 RepID=M0D5E5_HALPD|nr:mechanosensitive ion channel domain-containing protein [Halogeometricum pallidum]ELZ30053.1 small-conductance mechanosensitive channel [Halogeometricum pallidum JCM 14848]